MDALKDKIRSLLSQDMILEVDFKNQVLENLDQLDLERLNKILDTLNKLIEQETEVIENILKEKPYFFIEVQHEVLEIMHNEFEKEEAVYRETAESQLEMDIKNLDK